MEGPAHPPSSIHFGPFELDVETAELAINGHKERLHDQPFQVLLALLERPGRLVTREELAQRLWPAGTFVDFDRSLNKAVNKLREVLGDSAEDPQFIETLPRRGYRFIAPVRAVQSNRPAQSAGPVGKTGLRLGRHALILSAVLASLVLVFYATHRHYAKNAKASNPRVMLVVLPFENLTHDPDQEYFTDGMTEEMISQLGGLQPDRLGVIARDSAMKYKNSDKAIDQIGKELKVDYVLETSVRRSADRVRITAQLIQVSDQSHLWAQSYDRHLGDVLATEVDVARAIASEIQVVLPTTAEGLTRVRPIDVGAYEAFLKGTYYFHKFGDENRQRSRHYFEEAIAKDPNYALPYFGLAACHYFSSVPVRERVPKAEILLQRALALNSQLAEPHALMGYIYLQYHWDWPAAERELKRAIALNPSYRWAHSFYADYLAAVGRLEESLAENRLAAELDPVSGRLSFELGARLASMHRYDDAIAAYRNALELSPELSYVHYWLGAAYEAKGMPKQAVSEWQTHLAMEGDKDLASGLSRIYANSGLIAVKKKIARKHIADMEREAQEAYVPAFDLANFYAELGDNDQVFRWLEKAYAEREPEMAFLKLWNPNGVQADPRFSDLVRRIGIP